MSWRHRKPPTARPDENQGPIVAALRAAGATVQNLAAVGSGCPDLMVGFRRVTHLLEVKRQVETFPGRHANGRRAVKPQDVKLRASQEKWHHEWRGLPVSVVSSPEEALRVVCGHPDSCDCLECLREAIP